MDFCTVSNDIDEDGFDDNCEYRIASRFKPLLATNPSDDVSREPYWVATYRSSLPGGGGEGVEIMYLFSYHVDLGKDLGPPIGVVDAHSGDSEFDVLRVVFDDTSEHWMLQSSFYAAHHNAGAADSDYEGNYNRFEYPDNVERGYPRVWVAHDKHGSYRSKSACNRGGLAKADDCSYNYDDERVEVLESRNLGSGIQTFVNCTYSESPVSYPGTECFWDISHFDYSENEWVGYEFCGWDLDRSSCASGYGPVLAEFAFRSYP